MKNTSFSKALFNIDKGVAVDGMVKMFFFSSENAGCFKMSLLFANCLHFSISFF